MLEAGMVEKKSVGSAALWMREAVEATFWLGVIAFGKQADALARHSKGDPIAPSTAADDRHHSQQYWRFC